MRSKEIVVPILNQEYKAIVIISANEDYIFKKINDWGYEATREYVKENLTDRRGATFYHKYCHPIIVLPKVQTAEDIGTLAHEAFHAVDNIMVKIGETSYDEVVAHSIGAVVREVLKVSGKL